ncbi:MAG: hypothetical protein ACTH07_10030, partial [Microbacterium sp.]
MSIRVMPAGDGYRYLQNSVVIGDGDRDAASALTRYYLESGTPLSQWSGAFAVASNATCGIPCTCGADQDIESATGDA